MNIAHLADWMPIRVHWQEGYPLIDWCYLGKARFVESFFDETIEKRLRQPFNLLFRHQTPLQALSELQALEPGVAPTGFIFHMSRCGSTLVAQILVSHQRQRGAQMVPGLLSPQWLQLDAASLAGISLDEYCAWVLAQIGQAALQYHNGDALFVNYRRLPAAVWTEIARHFRVDYSAAEIDCMRQAAQFDAKQPSLFFVEDTSNKIRATTAALCQLAERWLMPVYAAMEAR